MGRMLIVVLVVAGCSKPAVCVDRVSALQKTLVALAEEQAATPKWHLEAGLDTDELVQAEGPPMAATEAETVELPSRGPNRRLPSGRLIIAATAQTKWRDVRDVLDRAQEEGHELVLAFRTSGAVGRLAPISPQTTFELSSLLKEVTAHCPTLAPALAAGPELPVTLRDLAAALPQCSCDFDLRLLELWVIGMTSPPVTLVPVRFAAEGASLPEPSDAAWGTMAPALVATARQGAFALPIPPPPPPPPPLPPHRKH